MTFQPESLGMCFAVLEFGGVEGLEFGSVLFSVPLNKFFTYSW